METLDNHNQIHNDIKPQNYLVKFTNGSYGNRQKLRKFISRKLTFFCYGIDIVLTDFGLAGPKSKGGTPIFASPECLADGKRKAKSTDIFSLGRVFLFMILPKEQFLEFLFVPLAKKSQKKKITELIEKEPILSLISKMMRIKKRLDLRGVRDDLQSIEQLLKSTATAEISGIIQKSTSNCTIEYIDVLKNIS